MATVSRFVSQFGSGLCGYMHKAFEFCKDPFGISYIPKGEIVEWSVDKSKLRQLVADSTPLLPGGITDLVVQYLKKTHQIGPEDLVDLYGEAEVVWLFAQERSSLPLSIDQELPLPYPFHQGYRITEAMSLIYVPKKMTANIAREWGKKKGVEIEESALSREVFEEIGDLEGTEDAWYLVSHSLMPASLASPVCDKAEALETIDKCGYEQATFRILLFSLFVKSAWTGKKATEVEIPLYYTCRDILPGGYQIAIAIKKNAKITIRNDLDDVELTGPIVMKKVAPMALPDVLKGC